MSEVQEEDYKQKIKDFIAFTETLPEIYRVGCFEALLKSYLSSTGTHKDTNVRGLKPEEMMMEKKSYAFPVSVRAFMSQYHVSEDVLQEVFLLEESNVIPIYILKTHKTARYQIAIALLLALENALLKSPFKFELSLEEVRKRCVEHKAYNAKNFTANFKNNKRLFMGLADTEHVELSNEGKEELAKILREVTQNGKQQPT